MIAPLSNNQCFLLIATTNPYFFRKQGVQLNLPQKLFILQFFNGGILPVALFQSIGIYGLLKLIPRPKYWARHQFIRTFPLQLVLLMASTITCKYLITDTLIPIFFSKQLQLIEEQNLINDTLIYNRTYIQNKLFEIEESSQNKTPDIDLFAQRQTKNEQFDPSTDEYRIRQLYKVEQDFDLINKLQRIL